MFLCDAATAHPDNTFSVLRGGINRFTLSKIKDSKGTIKNLPMTGALIATLELERTEMGKLHNVEIAFLNADGKRILPDIRANFQSPMSQRKSYHNIILNMSLDIKEAGEYCFYINVDGHELGSLGFIAVEKTEN